MYSKVDPKATLIEEGLIKAIFLLMRPIYSSMASLSKTRTKGVFCKTAELKRNTSFCPMETNTFLSSKIYLPHRCINWEILSESSVFSRHLMPRLFFGLIIRKLASWVRTPKRMAQITRSIWTSYLRVSEKGF